jgi:phage anti-repressor protein
MTGNTNETRLLDTTFMFLYESNNSSVSGKSLHPILQNNNVNPIRLLDRIHEIGFAEKEIDQQATMNGNTNIYSYTIKSSGLHFIEKLPESFNNKPYSYYLKLSVEKEIKIKEKEDLDNQKLKIDLENAKRIFKTYWWTFGIAVAAFLISLSLLIFKIIEK